MNAEPCKDCGGKYCMCEACQSMKKMLQELEKYSIEEMFSGISEKEYERTEKEQKMMNKEGK